MFSDSGEDNDYAKSMDLLDSFFRLKNLDFEIFTFCQATQLPEESVAQFCTRLRKLASTCEFHNVDRHIKAALIQNCLSTRLRRLALREDTLTLNDLLSAARALEVSDIQASDMERHIPIAQSSHNLIRIQQRPVQIPVIRKSVQRKSATLCFHCGYAWPQRNNV